VINFIVPTISLYITAFEKWDYASTRIKNEIWKQFLTTMLNLVIVCVLSVEFLSNKDYFGRGSSIISELYGYSCNENQIATVFAKLVL